MSQCLSLKDGVSIWHAMKWAEETLKEHQRPDAPIDAKLLMLYVMGYNETQLLLNRQQGMPANKMATYEEVILKRATGIPLQHITHEQEFMGLSFYVNQNVLIPRQDTESLIERILEKSHQNQWVTGIDIGTGTGCIGISLAYYIKGLHMTLVDISEKALEVAQYNVKAHHLENRMTLLQSNLLARYEGGKVDLIVSNPPYIAKKDMVELMIEVKDHEPHLALTDEGDGLDFYRKISACAKDYLRPGGLLAYEIGYDQGEAVISILRNEGYEEIELFQDLAGNNRVVMAIYN